MKFLPFHWGQKKQESMNQLSACQADAKDTKFKTLSRGFIQNRVMVLEKASFFLPFPANENYPVFLGELRAFA